MKSTMMRNGLIAIILLILPGVASAATFVGQRTIVVSDAPPDNTYLAGAHVSVTAPIVADLSATGGTVNVYAPVSGDALLAGGTIDVQKPVAGDIRAAGGTITVEQGTGGDFVAAGGSVTFTGDAKDIAIAGGIVHVDATSTGPVTIYGSDVFLSGTYMGDVQVVASDRVSIAEGTRINGSLKYNAPQQADIPSSALVTGGVTYVGSSSYLPTAKEAKTFAIVGAGVFLVVRLIAALIAAGLLAGLFPIFTTEVADRVLTRSTSRFILLSLLGFGVLVATPILIILLLLSFVGAGIAFVLAAAYLLFLLFAYLYAGVLAGAALARTLFKRTRITWRDAVLGTLVLHLVSIIPVIGGLVLFVLSVAAGGSIVALAYAFAFGRVPVEIVD